jgi:hypothetical protein
VILPLVIECFQRPLCQIEWLIFQYVVNYSVFFCVLQGGSAEGDADLPEFLECVLSDKEANISLQSKLFCYITKLFIHCRNVSF